MKFGKALKVLKGGGSVRRIDWAEGRFLYVSGDDIKQVNLGKCAIHWISDNRAILGDGWEEVANPR